MKVLTRYILKEFIRSFIISISIIYAILLIQLIIKLLDKFLGKGFDSYFLLKLLFYNTAWIIAMAIPMAVLVASILTYGKLSSDNEVVGFKSSGIKMYDIIQPSLFSATIIACITIYFSCNVLPKMNYQARKLNHELSRKRPDVEFEENIYSDLIPNHIMKFKERDKVNKSKFYDIIIHQIYNNRLTRTVIADSVIINSNNQDIMFNLFEGTIHERIAINEEYRQINFQNYKLRVPIDKTNNRKMKYIRGDRELTLNMFPVDTESILGDARKHLEKLAKISESTIEEIERERLAWEKAEQAIAPAKSLCDIICGTRINQTDFPVEILDDWNYHKAGLKNSRFRLKAIEGLDNQNMLHFPCFPPYENNIGLWQMFNKHLPSLFSPQSEKSGPLALS